MSSFKLSDSLRYEDFCRLTDIRVNEPERVTEAARNRVRRHVFTTDGKLNIVAADHPARATISAGSMATAMANRYELLARIIRILQCDTMDGVLAGIDILDELLMVDSMRKERGESGVLDGKVLIGSLNRGGLPGTAWELDDTLTGPTPEACSRAGFDAVKILLRIDKMNPDSNRTLMYCVEMIREATRLRMPMFLEPLAVKLNNGRYTVSTDPEAYIELLGVASALGDSSRYLWLKLPYMSDYTSVIRATTLPVVLLGGDRSSTTLEMITQLEKALSTGHQVRGVMYGRNLLFPGENDPLLIAEAIGGLVHGSGVQKDLMRRLQD